MRRMLFGALFFSTCLALQAIQTGQSASSIEGVLLDVGTGKPLSDVLIALGSTSRSVLTDAEGRFTIGNVPEGRYRLDPVRKQYFFWPTPDATRAHEHGTWVAVTERNPAKNVE